VRLKLRTLAACYENPNSGGSAQKIPRVSKQRERNMARGAAERERSRRQARLTHTLNAQREAAAARKKNLGH
jgi:hypothetical protein